MPAASRSFTLSQTNPGGSAYALVEPQTIIRYSADQRLGALLVARNLAANPVYQEVTGIKQLSVTLGRDYEGVLLLPKTEDDLVGTFPGLGGKAGVTVAPTTTTPPTTSRGASRSTVPSSSTTITTTTVVPSVQAAPTTTSGIYGRPPDGVACK